MLRMVRAAYDDQNRAVEYGSHIYRASRYSFDLTLSAWLSDGEAGRGRGGGQVTGRLAEAVKLA